MQDKYVHITLYCPICGNDQFSFVDSEFNGLSDAPDDTRIKCADCNCILTKAELISENQDVINANIEKLKEKTIKELERELKKLFK